MVFIEIESDLCNPVQSILNTRMGLNLGQEFSRTQLQLAKIADVFGKRLYSNSLLHAVQFNPTP
jgi:hypothetical protein